MRNLSDIARVLRQREFRLLWLANSFSFLGDSLIIVTLALYLTEKTGSAIDLGLVLAVHAVTLVGFLLLGGVWADRLPRHRVLVVTDGVRFALHGLLAVLIFSGSLQIWELLVIEALFGVAEAFAQPAANGLVPQTVNESEVQQATAVSTMTRNVTEFVGPALASLLVLAAGAGWAFAVDSAAYLVSAVFLFQMRPRKRLVAAGAVAAGDENRDVGVLESLREGSREVASRPWVWATLASFCAGLFFGLAPWFVLGPQVAKGQYGHLFIYGVVEAAIGLGTIAGSLIGVAWRPRYPMRMAMLMIMIWPIAAILYGAGVTMVLVVPATVVAGLGISLFDVWWLTALTERIPPDRLSRVTAYDWMVSGGLLPIGYLVAGPLGQQIGSATVLIGGAALAFVAFAAGLIPRSTRMLRRLEDTPPAFGVEEPMESIAGRY